MKKRFTANELFRIRNEIPVNTLIKDELRIPSKISEGIFRFLCPVCNEFQTSTKPTTNLARCFRCERNFNTIELVMSSQGSGFVDSVLFLRDLLGKVSNRNEDYRQAVKGLIASIGHRMP